ncbi:hypothetical protein E2562_031022 [Oryza meyeriana var. granulata]|uniref:Uncharacterized protein n=1 Tax=Oryza meyeriana var. granulata TaxID=110450 RepID=A0A6G1ERK8_9ORYZ|nr:hypothetical protein E2562_031022 [Oryza meyeriana var. granulata]
MCAVEQNLRGKPLVATVLIGRRGISPAMRVEELGGSCGVLPANVRVEVTRPSDFLLSFAREEDCEAVFARSRRFSVAGASISFRRWHRSVHARSTKMLFVVRLAIEGLPTHAVEPKALKHILNKLECQFIEFFEPVDACMTEVLAWSATLSNPQGASTGHPGTIACLVARA